VLAETLSHPAQRVRSAAARGLAQFAGSGFALDALMRALQDASVEVRLCAAVALKSRREARLAPALVQRFDEEPELEVQLALIEALGRLGAIEGVQKLVALTSSDARQSRRRDGPLLRLAAIEALGEARTPQAMVTLQKLLEDRDKEVRETAARLYSRARRQTSTGSIAVVSEP
jgi:HEAT repeat protein